MGRWIQSLTDGGINLPVRLVTRNQTDRDGKGGTGDSVGKLSKHRVLFAGIFSPLLALVLNIIFIQALLALSSNPESNWRCRLFISSSALPIPFLATLVLALKITAAYCEARSGRPCPFKAVTQHGNARRTGPDVQQP